MKTRLLLLLITTLILLADQAGASFWFQVIDVTPVEMYPNSQANFTASVKGLGSERAYVQLVFRDIPPGLTISCPKKIRNVFPKGVTEYNCTVMVGDVAPGNYSFIVDAIAANARPGKMTAYINVIEPETNMPIQPEIANQTTTEIPSPPEAEPTPGTGAIASVLALLLVLRRMKI
jgi:hypothetical protein